MAYVPLFCRSPRARPLGLKSPTSFLQDIWVAFPGNTSLPGSASKLASPSPHFRFLFFKIRQNKKIKIFFKITEEMCLNTQFKTERLWRCLCFFSPGSPDLCYELDMCLGVLPWVADLSPLWILICASSLCVTGGKRPGCWAYLVVKRLCYPQALGVVPRTDQSRSAGQWHALAQIRTQMGTDDGQMCGYGGGLLRNS